MAIEDKKINELVDVGEVNAVNANMEVPANLDGQDVKFTPQMVADYAAKSTPTTAILSSVAYSYDKNTRVFLISNAGSGNIQYRIQGLLYSIPTGSNITLPAFSTEKRLDAIYLSADGLEYETDENLVRNYNDKILLQVLNNLTVSFDDSNLLHKTGSIYQFETVEGEKTFKKIYSKQALGSQDVDLDLASENPDEIDLLDTSFVVCSTPGEINKISINFDLSRWPGAGLRTDNPGDKEGIITGGTSRAMIVKTGTVVKHNADVDDSVSFQQYRPVLTQTGEDYTATRDAMIILYYDRYRQVWRMAGYESVVEQVQNQFNFIELFEALAFEVGLTTEITGLTIDVGDTIEMPAGATCAPVLDDVNNKITFSQSGSFYGAVVKDSIGDIKAIIPGQEGHRDIITMLADTSRTEIWDVLNKVKLAITNWVDNTKITESYRNHFKGSYLIDIDGTIMNKPINEDDTSGIPYLDNLALPYPDFENLNDVSDVPAFLTITNNELNYIRYDYTTTGTTTTLEFLISAFDENVAVEIGDEFYITFEIKLTQTDLDFLTLRLRDSRAGAAYSPIQNFANPADGNYNQELITLTANASRGFLRFGFGFNTFTGTSGENHSIEIRNLRAFKGNNTSGYPIISDSELIFEIRQKAENTIAYSGVFYKWNPDENYKGYAAILNASKISDPANPIDKDFSATTEEILSRIDLPSNPTTGYGAMRPIYYNDDLIANPYNLVGFAIEIEGGQEEFVNQIKPVS